MVWYGMVWYGTENQWFVRAWAPNEVSPRLGVRILLENYGTEKNGVATTYENETLVTQFDMNLGIKNVDHNAVDHGIWHAKVFNINITFPIVFLVISK